MPEPMRPLPYTATVLIAAAGAAAAAAPARPRRMKKAMLRRIGI
jgi:hypothetical protein